jgi:hypothetical protein
MAGTQDFITRSTLCITGVARKPLGEHKGGNVNPSVRSRTRRLGRLPTLAGAILSVLIGIAIVNRVSGGALLLRSSPEKVQVGIVEAISEDGGSICLRNASGQVCAVPQLGVQDAPPAVGTPVVGYIVDVPLDSAQHLFRLSWVAFFPLKDVVEIMV